MSLKSRCPIHGFETRRIGMLEICDLCRDGVPPPQESPSITVKEALRILREVPNPTLAFLAAYDCIVYELRKLQKS